MNKIISLRAFAALALGLAVNVPTVFAQRPRTIEKDSTTASTQTTSTVTTDGTNRITNSNVPAAPNTFKAKYEGGVFGYRGKMEGTLSFDDANRRMVFRDKSGKEVLSFPYDALLSLWPDTQARRPTGATVVGSLPLPYGANIPALFIKKKQRYVIMQFDDPETRAGGTTSFKLENKELVQSVIQALCGKANLKARGDSCYRPRANDPNAEME